MAQSKFIQSVIDAAKGRPKSTQWYRDKIDEFGKPGAMDLIRDGKRNNKPFYGRLNMFFYDPKFKKTLPYYDRFPLIFPIDFAKGGFYGINFHYLQPGARVNFLRQLSRFASDKNFDSKTRYNIGELSGRYYKKTIKHYLYSQVRTSFLNITAEEMAIAIFLPVARFKKGKPY
jgi:hypothetical protein